MDIGILNVSVEHIVNVKKKSVYFEARFVLQLLYIIN